MSVKSDGCAVDTAPLRCAGHRTRRTCVRNLVLAAAAGLALCMGSPTAEASAPPPNSAKGRPALAQKKTAKPTRVQRKSRERDITAPGAAIQVPGANDPRPSIDAGDGVHDFGTVWVGPILKHIFKITNRGDGPLEILRVKPSCGCTIAGKYPKKLAPGETGEFPFSVSSTKLRGKFEKAITITSNDPSNPSLRLRLRGEVKRYVNLVPASVHFGKLYGGEPRERVIKITNNTDTPLKLTMSTPLGKGFEAELTETIPGQTFELVVKARPPFKPGTFRKSLVLETNVENQKTIKVDIRGSVPQRLDVNPTVLTLGRPRANQKQAANRKITRVVRFTNYGAAPTKLLEATIDDPAIAVSVKEQSPGKAYTVRVDFPAGYEVPSAGRVLTLKTDDAEKPTITIPIRGFASRRTAVTPKPRGAERLVGKPAPVFSLTTTAGKSVSNAKSDETIKVLDFFALNCPHCKRQIPRLEKIRAAYEGKPVRFIAVAQTMRNKKFTDQQIVDKIKELGFRGELALDTSNKIGPLFGATSYPTLVVIGKTGKVEAVSLGNRADLETSLKSQLDALLGGKAIPKIAKATPKATPKLPKPSTKRTRPNDLIGKPAPAFTITTFEGKTISNTDFSKHPATVLNFVAMNCGYCKKQLPRVEKLRAGYVEKGVRFVNIVQTMRTPYTKEKVISTLDKIGSKLEIAHDVKNEIGKKYSATGFPTMVIVGKSGKVEAVNVGNLADLEKRLATQLDALIAGKPVPKIVAAPRPKRKRATDLVGKPAPAFTLDTFAGKSISNTDFAKHPATVLNFVAANCGYCKKQVPRIEKLRPGYVEKGVRFVNIVQTMRTPYTKEQIISTFKKAGSKLELAQDLKNVIGRKYGATGFPTMVIVGRSGKIEAVNSGNIGDLEKRMSAQLDALIAGKPMPKFASAKRRSSKRPAQELEGKAAPQFSFKTLDGKTIANADLKEHVATVLNFVAPNCGYCKRALPKVEKVRKEYESKGIRFVNVAQKMRKDFTNDQIVDVFKKAGANLEISTSDFGANLIGKKFKVTSFPTMFVLGKNGMIANVNVGAKPNLDTLLKGQLDALIKGKPTTQAPGKDAGKVLVAKKP